MRVLVMKHMTSTQGLVIPYLVFIYTAYCTYKRNYFTPHPPFTTRLFKLLFLMEISLLREF